MARIARVVCGKCGAGFRADEARKQTAAYSAGYAVRVGTQWIARFTYPTSMTNPEKAWLQAEGVRIAACCKAVLGDAPFVWRGESRYSASFIARSVETMMRESGGEECVDVVWLCAVCAPPADGKRRVG